MEKFSLDATARAQAKRAAQDDVLAHLVEHTLIRLASLLRLVFAHAVTQHCVNTVAPLREENSSITSLEMPFVALSVAISLSQETA